MKKIQGGFGRDDTAGHPCGRSNGADEKIDIMNRIFLSEILGCLQVYAIDNYKQSHFRFQ